MKQISISEPTHKELKILAAELSVTLSVAIRVLIASWKEKHSLQAPDAGEQTTNPNLQIPG